MILITIIFIYRLASYKRYFIKLQTIFGLSSYFTVSTTFSSILNEIDETSNKLFSFMVFLFLFMIDADFHIYYGLSAHRIDIY